MQNRAKIKRSMILKQLYLCKMKRPKAISLFSGGGGCSLGFKNAGYDIIYASDFDKAAMNTYKTNFPETKTEIKDIKDIDFHELLKENNLRPGKLDFLIGGPPCQGFSTAGTRFWDDPRNSLLKEYVRCLSIIKPKWFLMENVEGLLTTKKGEYLYEAAKAFIELGYTIRIDKIYAHEYGVPQRRKRVFVIGNNLGFPYKSPLPINVATGRIFKNSSLTLGDALINLPLPSNMRDGETSYSKISKNELFNYYHSDNNTITDHFFVPINGMQLKRIKALKEGQTMKDLPEDLQHESFKRRANRRVMDGTPTEKRGGAPFGLKRLFANQPSLTITSAATREFIHPTEDRTLTIRECARLQTFPDDFIFKGNQNQRIQQIGNAIPPLLAQKFAKYIKEEYGFEKMVKKHDGKLIGYSLTKAEAMSPALANTHRKLSDLRQIHTNKQLNLF